MFGGTGERKSHFGEEISLKCFNPSTIPTGSISLILASKGSGKTTTICDLLQSAKSKEQKVYYFTPVSDLNCEEIETAKENGVYYSASLDGLEQLLEEQRVRLEQLLRSKEVRQLAKIWHGNEFMADSELEKIDFGAVWSEDPAVTCVIEDMAFGPSVWRMPAMRELFFNAKSRKITVIVTSQFLMDIPPQFRNRFEHVFLFHPRSSNSISERNDLFAQLGCHFFMEREMFDAVVEECTKRYGSVVFCQDAPTAALTDRIFWYRANSRAKRDFQTRCLRRARDADRCATLQKEPCFAEDKEVVDIVGVGEQAAQEQQQIEKVSSVFASLCAAAMQCNELRLPCAVRARHESTLYSHFIMHDLLKENALALCEFMRIAETANDDGKLVFDLCVAGQEQPFYSARV